MRFPRNSVLLCGLLSCCGTGRVEGPEILPSPPPAADLILVVSRVHPLEKSTEEAPEALAVLGGRILGVSDRVGILRFRGTGTRILRFPGAHLFPGFTDAHGHLASLGASLEELDLRKTRSFEELCDRVRKRASRLPKGRWILGRGWDQTRWDPPIMPEHRRLSRLVPDHPVFLVRIDGHAALVNQAALEAAGIKKDTKDPPGGKILRGGGGVPTGVLLDSAMNRVRERIPAPSRETLRRRLLLAQRRCLSKGLTRVHDAGTSDRVFALLRSLEDEGEWKLGVYGMLPAPSNTGYPSLEEDSPRSRIRRRAVKFYADGALGSRSAALLADYEDRPGYRGFLLESPSELEKRVTEAVRAGFQPCIHAIGDRANRLVLDILERVLGPTGIRRLRPRIEHAQVLAVGDLDRLARSGILASMQPTHLTSDLRWAGRRLGPSRLEGAYAFHALLERGGRVCFGSDFPVEPVDPFAGVFAAVTTRPPESPDSPAFAPSHAVDRKTALIGFCRTPHTAAFEEGVRGRLAPGFEADFTIVDRDLERVPDQALLGTRVLATVVHGEVVWTPDGDLR